MAGGEGIVSWKELLERAVYKRLEPFLNVYNRVLPLLQFFTAGIAIHRVVKIVTLESSGNA